MKHLSIKVKILIFLVPALLYMTGTSMVLIYQNYQLRARAGQLEVSGRYFVALSRLIQHLQKERGLSAGVLTGKIDKSDLESHRKIVDTKLNDVQNLFDQIPEILRIKTSDNIKYYKEIRSYVDAQGESAESTKRFSVLVENLITLQSQRARQYSLNGLESRLISQSIFEMAKENAGRMRAFVVGILGQDKALVASDLAKINTFRLGITLNLESQGLVISEQARQNVNEVLASSDWADILKTLQNVEARSTTGGYGENAKVYFDTITRVIDSISQIIDRESDGVLQDIRTMQDQASSAFWLYLICGVAGVFVISLIAIHTTREVITTLTLLASDLSQSATVVAQSSQKLSSASGALSSGVTEQAAALQETVSSLEEIRAMVGKNTENSNQAKDIAVRSREEVNKGKSAVSHMLLAVDEIEQSHAAIEKQVESSHVELMSITDVISEIGLKTKIINDIVFQTRLLSFNASVEAARAGEHGKGFAVVAEEVGGLATMSGNAAKEIVQLLEKSIAKVDTTVQETKRQVESLIAESKEKINRGVFTAKQCEEALDGIAHRVDELEHVISEVATASREQASGIDEITKAMNELDQVTQSNSSSANQGAGVAEQLSQETTDIESFVHQLSSVVYGEKISTS